jgi:phosphopantothenoylcysteine decarboxylase/phosphopantothenate--cysteine ligase
LVDNARRKLRSKGCDLIVANDVAAGSGTLGGVENEVHLVTAEAVESWPRMSKAAVASRLVGRVIAMLHNIR